MTARGLRLLTWLVAALAAVAGAVVTALASAPVTPPFRTNPLRGGGNLYRRGGWRGQFERVRRWHQRVHRASPEDYVDFLYTFFQNCNHLADWVAADLPGGQAKVQRLLRTTLELRICRDLCNATKHFALNRPPKVEDGFADGREYTPADWPGAERSAFFIIAGGTKYDTLDLADRCMAAWEGFVEAQTTAPDTEQISRSPGWSP